MVIFAADMYKLLRSFLFLFDPEQVHYFSMNTLKRLCRIEWIRKWIERTFRTAEDVDTDLFGLTFRNKVGLGAGFDKNASYLTELGILGFGFVEIGTVTPLPQSGNERPRLFRLPADKALINRMGFNNEGAVAIAERLRQWRSNQRNGDNYRLVIGGNIGKNKQTPNEEAWKDYEICFKALHSYVDYFVVNVSSPNTPGLRELQDKASLRKIFEVLQEHNQTVQQPKPVLLKIAPDLSSAQIDDVIALALEINLDGLVACNTTISRENLITPASRIQRIGTGGLSGVPVKKRSTDVVKYFYEKTHGQIPVIASGGIFNGADAKEKLNAGASLVQVWTGFIYEGPAIVKNICKALR